MTVDIQLQIQRIHDENKRLLTIVLKHPEFEYYNETSVYGTQRSRTREGIRYDAYCSMVFNMLSELFDLCALGDNVFWKSKDINARMEQILAYKEYVFMHRAWWETIVKHDGGYGPEFTQFIDSILTEEPMYTFMG